MGRPDTHANDLKTVVPVSIPVSDFFRALCNLRRRFTERYICSISAEVSPYLHMLGTVIASS